MTSLAEEAEREGLKWLKEVFFPEHKLDPEKLTPAQWSWAASFIPCHIRCWRIGEPVTVKPGEPCPECGKYRPIPDALERLAEEDIIP